MANVENTHTAVWVALKRLDLNDLSPLLQTGRCSGDIQDPKRPRLFNPFEQLHTGEQQTNAIRLGGGKILSAWYDYYVNARPRSTAMTVIHRSLKSRLQGIVRRIERLEELLPQIKQKQQDKMIKDIELLNQKLKFLHKRMQMAESCCWEGMFRRAPLW
ncbi:uncharacterized protein [Salminus brasiliensis]|uniref:uncharacterized protein isoform X2 n=1 Tax=Salminus brasiliensis TaxID=930266 RepID=UPI003B82EAD9